MYLVIGNNQGSSNRNSVQQTSGVFVTESEAVEWARLNAVKNLQFKYTVYQGVSEVYVELPQPTVKVISI